MPAGPTLLVQRFELEGHTVFDTQILSAQLADLVGQALGMAELQAAVADKPLAILAPGSLGSQEYNSGRINAFVDDAGLVYRLSCG